MVALRKSVRPMLPANSTSPTKARSICGAWNTTCPGVWPGSGAHSASHCPLAPVSPSCSQRVGVKCCADGKPNIALLRQPSIRTDRPGAAHDGQLQALGQLARASRMVDMGVREPDLAQRKPQAIHLAQQHIGSPPGQSRRPARGIAPHDGGVLLEGVTGTVRVMQHGGDYWWLPSLCVSLSENLFNIFLEIALGAIGTSGCWVRRMGWCPCKQPGVQSPDFLQPFGQVSCARSALLHRLPIARAIGCALRPSSPSRQGTALQKM